MAIMRVACPECGAGLKSADGFEVGQEIECPKCDTSFTVEKPSKTKPAPVEDEDRPKKKKKKKVAAEEDDAEWSYKNSTARYAILGVLVVTMIVLGYFLMKKWKDEKNTVDGGGGDGNVSGYKGIPPMDSGATKTSPKMEPNPGATKKGGNKGGNKGSNDSRGQNPSTGPTTSNTPKAGGGDLLSALPIPSLGGGSSMTATEKEAKKLQLTNLLLGTWKADLGGGATMTVTYTKDGKFTETVTGASARETSGTWQVADLNGKKGLTLTRTGGGASKVKATFEGDEMIHDAGEMGVTAVFRK